MAAAAGESADGAGDGESFLAGGVRDGDREDDGRFRADGGGAEPPGTAGLAGGGVSRIEVGYETAVQDDRDVGDVPAGGDDNGAEGGAGSGKSPAIARPAIPFGC